MRSSRPAGTPFRIEGALYRPAQDCSRTYGGAVAINRVDELSPTGFEERLVTRLCPDPAGPYPTGLHTICAAGDQTIIDGKRQEFSWLAWLMKLRWERATSRRQRELEASSADTDSAWGRGLQEVPSAR